MRRIINNYAPHNVLADGFFRGVTQSFNKKLYSLELFFLLVLQFDKQIKAEIFLGNLFESDMIFNLILNRISYRLNFNL